MVLLIVNSTIYGGSGGAVGTYSLAAGATEIAIHEMGHTAFRLADEYAYYAGGAETGHDHHPAGEPTEPNVTTNTNRATLKWRGLVAAATALPTMSNPNCAQEDSRPSTVPGGTVGLFEGAHYYHCGAYRPEYTCKMQVLSVPFCRVCSDVIVSRIEPLLPVLVRADQGARRVFGRDPVRNLKSIYVVTNDGRLAQVWDQNGWNLDSPADGAGHGGLRFQGSPAVFGRDPARNLKSIYAVTKDGRLAQVWDANGWHLDFPAEGTGQPSLRFQGSPAVFGRDPARNLKSIYVVTNDGRLAQAWDDNGWHLDFPAENAGHASLRFLRSPAVFGRDPARNLKSLYVITNNGRLAQVWDDNGWHLDFPAESAGQASLRFQGGPAVFGRDPARNLKSLYVITNNGRLAQVWDANGWHLDFPAEGAGHASLRFQGSPAVFGRDPVRNLKSIYVVTNDGRLAQVWDDNGWHLDFPAESAGHASLRFQGSPAVFGRDPARNLKSLYVMTKEGRLAQVWDDNGWHLDFPAESAGQAGLRFQGGI